MDQITKGLTAGDYYDSNSVSGDFLSSLTIYFSYGYNGIGWSDGTISLFAQPSASLLFSSGPLNFDSGDVPVVVPAGTTSLDVQMSWVTPGPFTISEYILSCVPPE